MVVASDLTTTTTKASRYTGVFRKLYLLTNTERFKRVSSSF